MLSKKYTHKPILISNEIIELTQTYKYLGLTLDSSLTFIKHLSNLINTLNYKIYLLNNMGQNKGRDQDGGVRSGMAGVA